MRISRRTSGGRGEYEISEATPEGITPHDITDCRLILNLGRSITIDTATELRHAQGKFRLRMLDEAQIHLHRQLVAALLMPEAVRADRPLGAGSPVLQKGRYTVEHIQITRAVREGNRASLDIGAVIVGNRSNTAEEVLLPQRIDKIRLIWEERAKLPSPTLELVQDHEAAVTAGGPIPLHAEKTVADLQTDLAEQATDLGIIYSEHTDVLPGLLKLIAIEVSEPVVPVDEIDPEETELKRRTIREWKRWAARRGAASASFRKKVRLAYDSTCLICGKRFPSTPFNRVPGVDASHILPWAEYDLDRTDNGICLCKLHHWGFDQGILRIVHAGGEYAVEIPKTAREAIRPEETGFSIEVFESVVGPIPLERLPSARQDRPKPRFLNLLREAFGE